jgi:catechol 2,3-dioxygenase-like lactoylglutathione lyase family enzyme
MERDGLISRGVEETDRRKSRLAITEAGTRLLASDLDERKLRLATSMLATSMAQLLSPTEQEMLRIAITLMERLMPLGESPVHSPATIRSASEICRPPNHDSASSNPMQPYISSITLGVTDLARAIRFYRDGLGFPTQVEEGAPFAFFTTNGTRLSLIPLERLVAYIGPGTQTAPGHFGGLTLTHHVREKEHVVQVLAQAERAGATLVKPAQKTFWGGYSGIFSDLDGYLWEIAWGPMFKFDEQGALLF